MDCGNFMFRYNSDDIPPVVSGHGTAIFNTINGKCTSFAETVNFEMLYIEAGVLTYYFGIPQFVKTMK